MHWYYVLLIVIAALAAFLLLSSVGVRVLYDEKLFLWIRVGPVKIQVLPKKEKKARPGGTEAKKTSEKKKNKREKKHSAGEIKTLVAELLPPARRALAKAAGGLRIDYLRVGLVVGAESPARAAERYGKANALLWTVIPLIENAARIKKRDINIALDYAAGKSTASGELILHIRVYRGFAVMAASGIPILKAVLKFSRSGKPAEEKKEKIKDKAA